MYILHFLYPFIFPWIFVHIIPLSYCESCCNELGCANTPWDATLNCFGYTPAGSYGISLYSFWGISILFSIVAMSLHSGSSFLPTVCKWFQNIRNASWICMSSLCRGHANPLCIILLLAYVLLTRASPPSIFWKERKHIIRPLCQPWYERVRPVSARLISSQRSELFFLPTEIVDIRVHTGGCGVVKWLDLVLSAKERQRRLRRLMLCA